MGKKNVQTSLIISSIFLLILASSWQIEAKILAKCDAVKELERGGVSRTLIGHWICLMQSESGMNTRLVTGPGTASSYSFGIFQINSLKWCKRGRKGGICNARCEDFANDDIQDDIVCAVKIYNMAGWKEWGGWMKKCKGEANKPNIPNIAQCKSA